MESNRNLKISKEDIILSCAEIDKRFDKFFVITSDDEIRQLLNKAKDETDKLRLHFVKKRCYDSITKYSTEELKEIFNKQNQQYRDWCDDVAIFYVYRLFIDKQPIPIIKL